MHTELLSFSATQPNTGAAGAAFTGDNLQIKNNQRGRVLILAAWALHQVEGFLQIIPPSGHDTTRNIRFSVEANEPGMLMPITGVPWEVYPQETLGITIAGSNTAGDVETGHLLVLYEGLPGTESRLIDYDELKKRWAKFVTVDVSIAGSGAGYSGAEAINADSDLLKANRDYAVLGISTSTPVGAITLKGPDTGNVRIGVPGHATRPELTAGFFVNLARAYNRKLIPVINSGNRAQTEIGVAANENATTTRATLHLVMLDD